MSALSKKTDSTEVVRPTVALAVVLLMAALVPIGYAQQPSRGVVFSQPTRDREEPQAVPRRLDRADSEPAVVFSPPGNEAQPSRVSFSTATDTATDGRKPVQPRFSDPSANRAPSAFDTFRNRSYPLFSVAQDLPSETLPPPSGSQRPGSAGQGGAADQTLGEAPEETNYNVQFLRDDTILLDPGQIQWDITLQYLMNETDTTFVRVNGGIVTIGESQTRQRLLTMPIEMRLGLTPVTQVFVNVPFGWSNTEFAFLGTDEFTNSGGIGDISAGVTRQLIDGDDTFPDVLSFFSFSAPTGNSDFATSLATPGSALGAGFWTTSVGLTFIKTYDPVVLFGGFGYRHRFQGNFDTALGKITVNPGKQAFYRFGAGFAVNPQVTFSASFIGSYIGDDEVQGVRVGGSRREPMSVRLATTIVRKPRCKPVKPDPNQKQRVRTIEPFVNFGITDAAVDTLFGISFTH